MEDQAAIPDPEKRQVRLSESQVEAYMAEEKTLPTGFYDQVENLLPRRSSMQRVITTQSESGREFYLTIRRSRFNEKDFMIGIGVSLPPITRPFILRRYDGPASSHRNMIERNFFHGAHIHMATERYQARGMKEESYAEPTERFTTFSDAMRCAIEDGNFVIPPGVQERLFPL